MKQYVTDYLKFVNGLMSEYDNKVKSLKADNREDEAILYKVRLNICDIFCKMAEAADRKVTAMKLSEEEDQTRTFNREYLEWFEKIPANWKTNLELARKHNDVIIVSTEEIKLETAELLRGRFLDYAGGEILLKK
jgi:hypothetical protein